ncbi:MAG: hypothetical protein U0836_06900 [Pirellulales bacterium]
MRETSSVRQVDRRRWRQFSLRTLLLVSIGSGALIGPWMERARRQRLAVAALQDAGFQVFYGEPDAQPSLLRERLWAWFGPDLFETVTGLEYSYFDRFRRRQPLDGPSLEAIRPHLESLPRLQRLDLTTAPTTRMDFSQLVGLVRLESLTVVDNGHSAEGLGSLRGLPRLESLTLLGGGTNLELLRSGWPTLESLSAPGTGDADAEILADCPSGLKHLHLTDCLLTDRGIRALAQIRGLRSVYFQDTSALTGKRRASRWDSLRALRPDVTVTYSICD